MRGGRRVKRLNNDVLIYPVCSETDGIEVEKLWYRMCEFGYLSIKGATFSRAGNSKCSASLEHKDL